MNLHAVGSDADVAGWRSPDVNGTASKSQTSQAFTPAGFSLAPLSIVTDDGVGS